MKQKHNAFQKKRNTLQTVLGVGFLILLALGWKYPLLGYSIPACMVLGIAIGANKGRKWCDVYCPRGSFFDSITGLVSPKKAIPVFFKNTVARASIMTVLMGFMIFQITRYWPDGTDIGKVFLILLTATTILGVIFAFIVHQRAWCYICPVGSMGNWLGRNKHTLNINSDLCIDCKLCEKVCPMQIKPYLFKSEGIQKVSDYDCIKCETCVNSCPKKALHF